MIPAVDTVDRALTELLGRHDLTGDRVADLLGQATRRMHAEVESVVGEAAAGSAVPEILFADIANDDVAATTIEAIRRRGCVVVRGTFDVDVATAWDSSIADYLERNHFDDVYRSRYAGAQRLRIWGIYWSPAQIAARQHPAMARTQAFVNSMWRVPGSAPSPCTRIGSHRAAAALRCGVERRVAAGRERAGLPRGARRRLRSVRPVGRRIPNDQRP
jgi:Protein of unknown function (DUF1479)